MMNILINCLVFGIPIILFIFYLSRKNKIKDKQDTEFKVKNIREDWENYKELYLDIKGSISTVMDKYKGSCGLLTFLILDTYYNRVSDLNDVQEHTKLGKGGGISRDLFLLTLLNNYAVTAYSVDKVKSKDGVEHIFNRASKESKLVVCILKDHVGVIVYAKKNTFIDLFGPAKEYSWNPNVDKLLVIEAPTIDVPDIKNSLTEPLVDKTTRLNSKDDYKK